MPEVGLLLKVHEEAALARTAGRMDALNAAIDRAARSSKTYGVEGAQYFGQAERAIGRLPAAVDNLRQRQDHAALSARQMNQAIGAMSLAFGGVNPALTGAVLSLSQIGSEMSGLSTRAKITTGGVVAVAAGISYLVAQSQEMDRVAARFTAIDMAVRAWNFSGVQQGLRETSAELDTLHRKSSTFFGAFMQGVMDTTKHILQMPTSFAEAAEAEQRWMLGLRTLMPIQLRQQEAQHTGEMAGLSMSSRQQVAQSWAAKSVLTEDLARTLVQGAREDIQAAFEAAKVVVQTQFQKEVRESPLEAAAARARRGQRLEQLEAKREISRFGADEQERQLLEGIRARAEAQRAAGAGLARARQAAEVEALQADVAASKTYTDRLNEAAIKAGKSQYTITGVNPAALELVEAEKRAKILAIEETLAKALNSIDQVRLQDDARIRAIADAQATADTSRRTAIEAAAAAERGLYDEADRVRDATEAAANAAQVSLAQGFEQARQSAEKLRQQMQEPWVSEMPGEAHTSSTAGGSAAWKKFWGPAAPGEPGSAEWWAGGAWGTGTASAAIGDGGSNIGSGGGVPSTIPPGVGSGGGVPTNLPGFQRGGIVPGQLDVPRPITAHGGEGVFTREQMAALGVGGITINLTANNPGEDPAVFARRVAREVIGEIKHRKDLGYT